MKMDLRTELTKDIMVQFFETLKSEPCWDYTIGKNGTFFLFCRTYSSKSKKLSVIFLFENFYT